MITDPTVPYEPTEGLTGQGPVILARLYFHGEVRAYSQDLPQCGRLDLGVLESINP